MGRNVSGGPLIVVDGAADLKMIIEIRSEADISGSTANYFICPRRPRDILLSRVTPETRLSTISLSIPSGSPT